MTCIVGKITSKGSVIIGGDSAGVAADGSISLRKDPKVFIRDGFAFGFTSSFRMGDILRYNFVIPQHDPNIDIDLYLRSIWIDTLRITFSSHSYSSNIDGGQGGGTFLLGYRNRLFTIHSDFQVGESMDDFAACGSGDSVALGAMFALKNVKMTDTNKVICALEAAEAFNNGVRAPFNLVTLPQYKK